MTYTRYNVPCETGTGRFPFIIQKTPNNYSITALQFPTLATHKDRDELLRLAREQLTIVLDDARQEGREPPPLLAEHELDLSDYVPGEAGKVPGEAGIEGEWYEVVYIEPAPTNPVSAEAFRLVTASGLSDTEIAKRMGTSRATLHRLTDPFYWGHTVASLRRLAEAVGAEVRVVFDRVA